MLTPGQEVKDERGMETSAPPCWDAGFVRTKRKKVITSMRQLIYWIASMCWVLWGGSLIRYHTYTYTRPQGCIQQSLSTYCVLGLGAVQGSRPSTDYTPWGLCFISCLNLLIIPKSVPTKAPPKSSKWTKFEERHLNLTWNWEKSRQTHGKGTLQRETNMRWCLQMNYTD